MPIPHLADNFKPPNIQSLDDKATGHVYTKLRDQFTQDNNRFKQSNEDIMRAREKQLTAQLNKL